jgi:hypothetical protein
MLQTDAQLAAELQNAEHANGEQARQRQEVVEDANPPPEGVQIDAFGRWTDEQGVIHQLNVETLENMRIDAIEEALTKDTITKEMLDMINDRERLEVKKALETTPFMAFVELFADQVHTAQEYLREIHEERSVVSLRDVTRCLKVFYWFGDYFCSNQREGKEQKDSFTKEDFFSVKPNAHRFVRQALVLALSYCYHARLPRKERKDFREKMEEAFVRFAKPKRFDNENLFGNTAIMNKRRRAICDALRDKLAIKCLPKCEWVNMSAQGFHQVLKDVQLDFVMHLNCGKGIALNDSLLENLFMLIISILNQIPIFVVGKPGSSKSLAMSLVVSNLNGVQSDNDFLKKLPAVEVFSYQCSPLSNSEGIHQTFLRYGYMCVCV